MREEFSSDLQVRNWMMELADLLIPKLKSRIIDDEGNNARYISVHDIRVQYEDLNEVIQFYCKIHYLSDVGDFEQEVLIRYFHSLQDYTLECAQYDRLLSRANFFDHIKPVELLVRHDPEQTLLYVAPTGRDLRSFDISSELYHFQIGHLYAILHGGDLLKIESSQYFGIMEYMVKNLGFTPLQQNILIELMEHQLEILDQSYAGYDPVTIIDISQIRCSQLDDLITKQKIIDGNAFYIEILPSLMPKTTMDRMEDFASLFALDAYYEFSSQSQVRETLDSIIYTLEGYELFFNNYSIAPIDTIYPNGLSLDLHMVLNIWLHFLKKLQSDEEWINIEQLFRFSVFILKTRPFQIYGK